MDSLPIPVDRRRSAVMETGHDGGLALLGLAGASLAAGGCEACLVGGVESYADGETLDWLDALGRLKVSDRPAGLIPGEGAAFLLLGTRRFAREIGAWPLAELAGASRTVEPNPWYLGEPTRGVGLTEALRGALRPAGGAGRHAAVVYADLNGENWRVDEWGYAYLRNAAQVDDPLQLHHPADCWGDVGAATGTLLAALSAHELARPRNGAPTALVWAACDTRPYRAACFLRAHEPQEAA